MSIHMQVEPSVVGSLLLKHKAQKQDDDRYSSLLQQQNLTLVSWEFTHALQSFLIKNNYQVF